MKRSFLLTVALCLSLLLFAQNELVVQTSEKGLILTHTVAPKENFYSIGRLYNISAKDIAAANALDMANGLDVGQVIRIPLTSNNFTQASNKGRALYYIVGEGEGLYRVSQNTNKVTMAALRQWNNLTNDNLTTGQKLIIGYLVSPEANNIIVYTPPPTTETGQPKTETAPPVQRPVENERTNDAPVQSARTEPAVTNTTPVQSAVNDGRGGFFKTFYDQQPRNRNQKELTVTSGVFKTSSGWQDSKYYALIDNVEPGTIIRITNPSNNKTIYAKVLDQMAGIRQNQGLEVRISNAAASVLDIGDAEKFIVKVNY
jgi:LysM repeat protein